jgi:hypothetical protein
MATSASIGGTNLQKVDQGKGLILEALQKLHDLKKTARAQNVVPILLKTAAGCPAAAEHDIGSDRHKDAKLFASYLVYLSSTAHSAIAVWRERRLPPDSQFQRPHELGRRFFFISNMERLEPRGHSFAP